MTNRTAVSLFTALALLSGCSSSSDDVGPVDVEVEAGDEFTFTFETSDGEYPNCFHVYQGSSRVAMLTVGVAELQSRNSGCASIGRLEPPTLAISESGTYRICASRDTQGGAECMTVRVR